MKQKPTSFRQKSEVVYSIQDEIVVMSKSEVDFLKIVAKQSPSKKSRVLLHSSPEKDLHEMLIVHSYGEYIQPHINAHSDKSFIVLEGEMFVVVYRENGKIKNQIHLSCYDGRLAFMLRLNEPMFHTVVPISETVTFLETIKGPHIETRYAPFAPPPTNLFESEKYMKWLMNEVGVNH